MTVYSKERVKLLHQLIAQATGGKMDFAALRTWLYEHVSGVDGKP